MKAHRVDHQDVDDQAADEGGQARLGAAAMDPVADLDPRQAAAQAGVDEERAADAEAGGNDAREPRRAELLARHGREPLDMPEDDAAQRRERGAGQCVMDLYLASPTAFSAAPRFVSDAAMNFAVSAGSAQTTPKPRLAMKSLYSFES